MPRMCSKVWLVRANDAAELGGSEVAISWVSSGGSRPNKPALVAGESPGVLWPFRQHFSKENILENPGIAHIGPIVSV